MANSITAYEANDGTIFRNEDDAKEYDLKCDIIRWYSKLDVKDWILPIEDGIVSSGKVAGWLIKNKEKIMEFFGRKE